MKKRCLILAGMLVLVYLLNSNIMINIIGSYLTVYWLRPVFLLMIALLVIFSPKVHANGKLKLRSVINKWALVYALVFVMINITGGFFDGFGYSPYGHTLRSISGNIFQVGSRLLAFEFIRNYLVNNFTKKEGYSVFILVSLFFTIIAFPLSRYTNIEGLETLTIFAAKSFSPKLIENLLATYLVYLGGPFASIIYLGTVDLFNWFSPVLPNLKWITTSLIGILVPAFCLVSLQSIYHREAKMVKKNIKDERISEWVITSLLSIFLVWFAVGVFPVYPTVIATGSMEPMIKAGDIILIQKIDNLDSLKVDDVIQFKKNDRLIAHRIIEIKKDTKEISFVTKGDNNIRRDFDTVIPEQIKGKVVKVVPKIGWPTLLLKKTDKNPYLNELIND